MSVEIGQLVGSTLKVYPVCIKEDPNESSSSKGIAIFDTLNSLIFMTYDFKQRLFICPYNRRSVLIELLKFHDIPFSIHKNEIAEIIKYSNNIQQVVKYANMPASGAFCFLFPSLYKNVNNIFLNHPDSHLFANNSDFNGAFSKTIIWYVPKHYGESILLDLKSMMVKIEFQPQK